MIGWYSRVAEIGDWCLRWAVFEFLSKPKPTFEEYRQYMWLQMKGRLTFLRKITAFYSISIHYALSLWKIKYYLKKVIPKRKTHASNGTT